MYRLGRKVLFLQTSPHQVDHNCLVFKHDQLFCQLKNIKKAPVFKNKGFISLITHGCAFNA
ncbi:MAG: hypothetical protein CMF60_04190 [Magnetococcales bacterium]|nr:hypothetical protein [Magnetococcales bacterium]